MPPFEHPVLIAGGGIGGLACAIALAQVAIPSIVLERRDTFTEAGAGIQIGPNGMRILRKLGVDELLEPLAAKPEALVVRDGASGQTITTLPLGAWLASRHGAPYWVAHRADLQRVLLDVAFGSDLIEIRTGFRVTGAFDTDDGVAATGPSEASVTGAALIGADGLWSSTRDLLGRPSELIFTNRTATRTTIAAETLPDWMQRPEIGVWLTPSGHAVHYPIRGGREIAIVLVAADDHDAPGWENVTDVANVDSRLADFAAVLAEPLQQAEHWRKWGLYRLPPLDRWSRGRMTLLGDAVHPMMPFLAQGGVLAIEDAAVLASMLASAETVESAFENYETARRARALKVQQAAERNGRMYHMGGPMTLARNTTMRLLGGERLMAMYDWLYGWRPD